MIIFPIKFPFMKFQYLLLFAFLNTAALAQNSLQDSLWIVENYYKIEQLIPMRDGVRLHTSIYIPKDTSEKHPFLMYRTPYSCAPYGEKNWMPLWNSFARYYMREGYILVYQDVRGRWMSEGEFMDIRPFNPNKTKSTDIDEASDTYDAIEWLLKNIPNNNGRVGVGGISYPGFYATMAALSNHPALKAVSPQAPVTDWFFGDDWHHNGALMLMDTYNFYTHFGYPRPVPVSTSLKTLEVNLSDNYQFYLETGAIKNFNEKYLHDSLAFWNEMFAHPYYDDWWKARNVRSFMKNIKPAMLVVGGLYDAEDCYGAWELYEAIEKQSPGTDNRLVFGPWSHGQWGRGNLDFLGNIKLGANTVPWFQNNIEIPFFNYHLKDKGSISNLPEATVFFSGENKWYNLNVWPPKEKSDQVIFLQPNGGLTWTKPTSTSAYSEYISDPAKPVPYTEDVHKRRTREYMTDDQRFASRRPDVLVFETEVMNEELTLTGTLIADLWVSTTGTDADFIVKVIDVFPDPFEGDKVSDYPMGGYQMLIRGEVMRGKFRNSFEKPEAFAPNKVARVKFELPDVAHTFKKGHKIMVHIQSTWFPLVDRNPQKFLNIYTAKDSDYQKASMRIYHDVKHSSGITLPVLKK
jgi:putative CocE/NonD family hydrolase